MSMKSRGNRKTEDFGSTIPSFFVDSALFSCISSRFFYFCALKSTSMYWTLELASYLEDAPWPATKDELIDFAMRTGAPLEVVENLQQLEDEGDAFETIEDIWPDYPSKEDFFFNEDEY